MRTPSSRLARLFFRQLADVSWIEVIAWATAFWVVAMVPRAEAGQAQADVVQALVPELARQLGYQVPQARPEVVFTHTLMRDCDCAPRGLYRDRVVYLAADFNPHDPRHLSVAVHELTHWLIDLNEGERFDCDEIRRREYRAVAMQFEWLNQRNSAWRPAYLVACMD